jgi:hypothetical protein
MRNTVLMVLLLGLLLMALVAPFSALAMLMLVTFGSAFLWVLFTLVQTLVQGNPEPESDRKS